jgi:hypothetical protein
VEQEKTIRLQQGESNELLSGLVNKELLVDNATVLKLCRHRWGHYAIHGILDHGSEEQQERVGEALVGNLWSLANHRHASHVVESALQEGHCPRALQHKYLEELAGGRPDALVSLGQKRYGSHVLKALVALVKRTPCDAPQQQVWERFVTQAAALGLVGEMQRILKDLQRTASEPALR